MIKFYLVFFRTQFGIFKLSVQCERKDALELAVKRVNKHFKGESFTPLYFRQHLPRRCDEGELLISS